MIRSGYFFLVFAILCCAGCGSTDKTFTGHGGMAGPVICLGDSITSGYNINGDGKNDPAAAFPAVIEKLAGVPVINAGVAGDTTEQALARLGRDVLSKNPRIVVVFLGINDLSKNLDFDTTERNMYGILGSIFDSGAKIFVIKFLPEQAIRWNLEQQGKDPFEQEAVLEQYDRLYDGLKNSFDAEIIDDIWDGIWQILTPDGIHPDAAGQEIIGKRVYEKIKFLFE